MTDTAYLVANPPARSQYRKPRRARPSGVVVAHTAENTPDTVATDGGAEAVAGFIRRRPDPGSYHDLVDSDSALLVVPYEWEAFQDGTGSNPHALSISIATRADWWPWAPPTWRARALLNFGMAARRQRAWLATHDVVLPARRINRAESERLVPGFITHAERDPGRRSDPGFRPTEWDTVFAVLDDQEDDMAVEAKHIAAIDLVDRTYRTERAATRLQVQPTAPAFARADAPEFDGLRHYAAAIAGAADLGEATNVWLELVGKLRQEQPRRVTPA